MVDLIDLFEDNMSYVNSLGSLPIQGLDPTSIAQSVFNKYSSIKIQKNDLKVQPYASWIEGQSLSFPLITHKQLLVDLIYVKSEDEFAAKYEFTLQQMRDLVVGGHIKLNIRDNITSLSSKDEILRHPLASDDNPSGWLLRQVSAQDAFCAPILRNAYLDPMLGKTRADVFFKSVLGIFEQLKDRHAIASARKFDRTELDRSGSLPHPRAVAFWFVFYRCLKNHSRSIVAEARYNDPCIDEVFGEGHLPSSSIDDEKLVEAYQKLRLFHLYNSAPLTGGWGGQFMRKKSEQDVLNVHFNSPAVDTEESFERFMASLVKAQGRLMPPEFLVLEFDSRKKNMNSMQFSQFISFLASDRQGHLMEARRLLRQSLLALVSNMEIRSNVSNYQSAVELSFDFVRESLYGAGFVGRLSDKNVFGFSKDDYNRNSPRLLAIKSLVSDVCSEVPDSFFEKLKQSAVRNNFEAQLRSVYDDTNEFRSRFARTA